ncbi:MAG: bifunctional nuclease family protein [Phycisphaerales bacterium]|nr:MAG: bifunctional nuclease family protein [Phycisphaerales bacterium]
MLVRIALARIIINESGDQAIILREVDGVRTFPVMIGLPEALAIDRRIKGQKPARPLTHDLLHSVIEKLGGELERIVIHELKQHTFYAKLYVRQNGSIVEIDARPSDAIALGAGSDTPMFVSQSVLDEVG